MLKNKAINRIEFFFLAIPGSYAFQKEGQRIKYIRENNIRKRYIAIDKLLKELKG